MPRAPGGVCTPGHHRGDDTSDPAALPVTLNLTQNLDWFGTVSGSLATLLIALSGASLVVGHRSHITDNILRFGVNCRFSGT